MTLREADAGPAFTAMARMVPDSPARAPGIEIRSVSGSLRLDNDGDITMARVLVTMANKSSRDTSRRVKGVRRSAPIDALTTAPLSLMTWTT